MLFDEFDVKEDLNFLENDKSGYLTLEDGKETQMSSQLETLSNPLTPSFCNFDFNLHPVVLVNIMASFSVGCIIDLKKLVISARNVEYNPKKINAATIRFQNPRLAATVFSCGRVNLCGSAPIKIMKYYSKLVAKIIQKAGHEDIRFSNFKIDSLAFSANCGFPIRLEDFAADQNKYCNYEPEIYCGLVYRYQISPEFKATVLIYVSGRLMITGCKKPSQADQVYRNLYALLYQYQS